MDKLRDGGSVVIKTFGKPLVDIFKQIGQSAKNVGDLAKNNRENWEKFSAAISRFVEGFFDLSRGFKTAFDAALPIISLMVKFVGQLMSLVGQLLGGAGKLGGIFGNIAGAAATIGIGFTAMKGRRAARYGTNKMLGYTQSGGQVPMSEEEFEDKMNTYELDQQYAEYIMEHRNVGNGEMLIRFMERGELYEDFKEHIMWGGK